MQLSLSIVYCFIAFFAMTVTAQDNGSMENNRGRGDLRYHSPPNNRPAPPAPPSAPENVNPSPVQGAAQSDEASKIAALMQMAATAAANGAAAAKNKEQIAYKASVAQKPARVGGDVTFDADLKRASFAELAAKDGPFHSNKPVQLSSEGTIM